MQIRLLVACRDRQLALALCAQIPTLPDVSIVAEGTDLASVVRKAEAARPDVLLLEHLSDQEARTWEVLRHVRRLHPRPRVLLACEAYTNLMVVSFIQHGASGCLLGSSDPVLFAKAVVAIHRGEAWFGRSALLQALRSHMPVEAQPAHADSGEQAPLTEREREVLKLIGSAMSNKEIARQLKISDKTVKTHLHHIYVKLHTSGRYRVFLSNAEAGNGPGVDTPGRLQ
jgi:DNA-binding NarL/FixJ family response regulator